MAAILTNIGTRATIALGTSAYDGTNTWQLKGIRFSGSERAAIDSSHMGTADMASATTVLGNRTYLPGELIAPGQLIVDIFFQSNLAPPYYATGTTSAETVTVTIPNGDTPGTWAFSGFLVAFEASIPEEEMMTATLTWQIAGPITITAGT